MLTPDLTFERAKGLPEQVADTIVDAISAGHLASGQRILEVDIAEQFNVSRVPVREAMRTLLAQGILQREGSRGLRVAMLDKTAVTQLAEARLAVEMIALRHVIARSNADPAAARTVQAGLQRRLDEFAQQARIGSPIGMGKADVGFHHELCAVAANAIAMTLWEAIARHVLIVVGKQMRRELSRDTLLTQHQALFAAVVSGDEARASRELHDHITEMTRPPHLFWLDEAS